MFSCCTLLPKYVSLTEMMTSPVPCQSTPDTMEWCRTTKERETFLGSITHLWAICRSRFNSCVTNETSARFAANYEGYEARVVPDTPLSLSLFLIYTGTLTNALLFNPCQLITHLISPPTPPVYRLHICPSPPFPSAHPFMVPCFI